MDCNSYSYAPHMLDGENQYIEQYENDDMEAIMEKSAQQLQCAIIDDDLNIIRPAINIEGFTVWAESYDGSLDVCEFYRTIEAASFLYNAIVDNFSDSAPTKKQICTLINQAKRIDKKGAKNNAT